MSCVAFNSFPNYTEAPFPQYKVKGGHEGQGKSLWYLLVPLW